MTDRLRAEGEHDPRGVANARATLKTAYGMIERQLADKTWATGEAFNLADRSAAPALFYAGIVAPFETDHSRVAAYFERLAQRPSFKRVIAEAQPYFSLFCTRKRFPRGFLARPRRDRLPADRRSGAYFPTTRLMRLPAGNWAAGQQPH